MSFIKGYKYNKESEAIIARKQAADFIGLPVPNGETLYWVDYIFSKIDNFYYIIYIEELELALGEPIEFEVTEPTR
jgi:hypothetical protein